MFGKIVASVYWNAIDFLLCFDLIGSVIRNEGVDRNGLIAPICLPQLLLIIYCYSELENKHYEVLDLCMCTVGGRFYSNAFQITKVIEVRFLFFCLNPLPQTHFLMHFTVTQLFFSLKYSICRPCLLASCSITAISSL